MTVSVFKWTLDLYHQAIAAGIFADQEQKLELLRGEIVVMPPEREPHAFFSDRFADRLRISLSGRAKIREGKPVILPNDSQPEPDIAIVQALEEVYLEHHPYVENIFWLIEYSNTTLKKDLEIKSEIYAEAGIQEYWVVDLKNLQVVIFRHPSAAKYQTELRLAEGAIAPLSFPDLSIEVRQLFLR